MKKRNLGFSIVEVLLAAAVFSLIVLAFAGSYLYGEEATVLSGNRMRAEYLAQEGIEATRNIRDSSFSNLVDGVYGLAVSGSTWNLSGSNDINGIFTRAVTISSIDANRKEVSCNVTWQQNAQRSGSYTINTYLTDWSATLPVSAACDSYAISQGYNSSICRQNANQCNRNGEVHLTGGDPECATNYPGDPSRDTCCVLP